MTVVPSERDGIEVLARARCKRLLRGPTPRLRSAKAMRENAKRYANGENRAGTNTSETILPDKQHPAPVETGFEPAAEKVDASG
jgi:hypothetical protein